MTMAVVTEQARSEYFFSLGVIVVLHAYSCILPGAHELMILVLNLEWNVDCSARRDQLSPNYVVLIRPV